MRRLFYPAISLFCLNACLKVPLPVTDNASLSDPNISYFDNYEVEISTYKIDSFITSGTSIFTVGYHYDSVFGQINAGTYLQIDLPSENPIKDKTVSFDSLVLILKPTGDYYGDTTRPFKIQVHRLVEKILNDEDADNNFYNPRKFSFDTSLLGTQTSVIRPVRASNIKIRLSDLLGQELLTKLKNDDVDIQDNARFINYFKGVYLKTDTSFSKNVHYFKPDSSSTIMRLYYHLASTFFQEKYMDFSISSSKQFNHIEYNHAGTNLSVFTPFKKQLKKSDLTGNKAYLHTNMHSFVKIRFPSILRLKELYPYVKVMKAELVVTPSPGTYRYPYQLPSSMYLYSTDDNNTLKFQLADNFTQSPLNGDLRIDELYGEQTFYRYDITSYVNSLIEEGPFSKSALMLVPSASSYSSKLQRLVINNQSLDKGVQLKLFLLGL